MTERARGEIGPHELHACDNGAPALQLAEDDRDEGFYVLVGIVALGLIAPLVAIMLWTLDGDVDSNGP
jgi:hypothetical protein